METVFGMLCAFLIAALSGMGLGSGGLLIVLLTLLWDVPQVTAQGINLLFFLFSSAASLFWHIPRRRLAFVPILLVSVAGILGTVPGSYAALLLPEVWVRRIFGGMLLVTGVISLFKRKKTPEKT